MYPHVVFLLLVSGPEGRQEFHIGSMDQNTVLKPQDAFNKSSCKSHS